MNVYILATVLAVFSFTAASVNLFATLHREAKMCQAKCNAQSAHGSYDVLGGCYCVQTWRED